MEEIRRRSDSRHFPILIGVAHDATTIQHIGPQHMDMLGDEIAMALKRCAAPESSGIVDPQEVQTNRSMMATILMIDSGLKDRAKRSMNSRDGALLMLFQKTVSTPANLQALFSICDPAIRTGRVRTHALQFLSGLATLDSVWKLQVPGNGPGEAPSSFGKKLIESLINAIKMRQCFCGESSFEDAQGICFPCLTAPWMELFNALPRALAFVPPDEVLDIFNTIQDWPRLLQAEDIFVSKMPGETLVCDFKVFISLHPWPCKLLAIDPTNIKAKTFLREQLGCCHELLRKVLRRIIAGEGEAFVPGANRNDVEGRLNAMKPTQGFLERFLHCLVPVPADRETMSLVRRARNALTEYHTEIVLTGNGLFNLEQETQVYYMCRLITNMEHWQDLHDESEQARWERFRFEFLSEEASTSAAYTKQFVKTYRKEARKKLKEQRSIQDGEMCANCFVLEKTLLDESNQSHGLMKCTRCLQMKYCSRECQVEHWKKAHKKHCKKVEKAAASSSSESKS